MTRPVNNIPNQNSFNRLSKRQRAILAYLDERCAFRPLDERIGHLPRTGQIIDGLDLDRTPTNYASVSRSLERLRKAGLVEAYSPSICTQGKGWHYALAALTAG